MNNLTPPGSFFVNRFKSPCKLFVSICIWISFTVLSVSNNTAQTYPQQKIKKDFGALPFLAKGIKDVYQFLGKGEIHVYYVRLNTKQYIHVDIVPVQLDTVATFYAPDGTKVEEVLLPPGSENQKHLMHITQTAGDYRLEIRAPAIEEIEMYKGLVKESGHYAVAVRNLIDCTDENQKYIEADKYDFEATRLSYTRTGESLTEAIDKFQKAISIWEELAKDKLLSVELTKGRFFNSSEANYRLLNALMELGECYHYLSDYPKAIETYNQVANYLKNPITSDAKGVDPMWVYNNIGSAYRELGEKEKALEFYKLSLKLAQEGEAVTKERGEESSPRSFAIPMISLGNIYFQIGEMQTAIDKINKAIPYINKVKDDKPEFFLLARAYRTLSQIHITLGEYERAVEFAKQALQHSRETSDKNGEIAALNISGSIHFSSGKFADAEKSFRAALNIAHISGDKNGKANALINLGYVYHTLNNYQPAKNCFEEALEILKKVKNISAQARALAGLGLLSNSLGKNSEALEFYKQSVQLHQTTKDRVSEADALFQLSRVYILLNNYDSARQSIENAIEKIELLRTSFAGAGMRASYQSTVQNYYKLYISLLMSLHKKYPLKGFDALAFEKSEQARARSLLESLREANANIHKGVDSELLKREKELEQRLKNKWEYQTRLLSGTFSPERKDEIEREMGNLLDEYKTIQAQIRASSPHYAALTQPQNLSLKDIRNKVLDEDSILLEYELGEEKSFLWVITQNQIVSLELPKRAEIESVAKQFYDSISVVPTKARLKTTDPKLRRLNQTRNINATAATLSKILLQPALQFLDKKRLLIVPDGALHYVPFAALPIPSFKSDTAAGNGQRTADKNPLITLHEIVMLPSASTLAVLRQENANRKLALEVAAVFADPVFSANDERVKYKTFKPKQDEVAKEETRSVDEIIFKRSLKAFGVNKSTNIPRLFSTRSEANAIRSLAAQNQTRIALDFAASQKTVFDIDLSNYRIIHFATHGFVDGLYPELSGILLSLVDEQGKPQDGFLQSHEIYNLKLNAELVVLSACETALGKEIKGEGLISLTRGFMYAGAKSVASSLWKVDSAATAELMKRFYQAMLKDNLPPSAALRKAQLSMMQETKWNAPYYWSAFILQGEYQ